MEDHAHHQDTDCIAIPEICNRTFLSIERAVRSLWIISIAIVIPAAGIGVGWAFAMSNSQSKQDVKIERVIEDQKKMQDEISNKLDILLRRGER